MRWPLIFGKKKSNPIPEDKIKSTPEDRNKDDLVTVAAEDLPWQKSSSGWAVVSRKDWKADKNIGAIVNECIEQKLGRLGHSPTLGEIFMARLELENAANAAHPGLDAHAARDLAIGNEVRDPRPSGQELIERGDQKAGREPS